MGKSYRAPTRPASAVSRRRLPEPRKTGQDIQIRGTELGEGLYADFESVPRVRHRDVFNVHIDDGSEFADSMVRGHRVRVRRAVGEALWVISEVQE